MGATNETTYYHLSQFVASDKPAWLQDYNGDMTKIDTGIKGALTAAQNAQTTADNASGSVTGLASDVTALQTTVAGHTADIGDIGGDVNTIESLIGNGTPTTTDQTIIGAINEINAKITPTIIPITTATTLAQILQYFDETKFNYPRIVFQYNNNQWNLELKSYSASIADFSAGHSDTSPVLARFTAAGLTIYRANADITSNCTNINAVKNY